MCAPNPILSTGESGIGASSTFWRAQAIVAFTIVGWWRKFSNSPG
jgi:hypothetical protein